MIKKLITFFTNNFYFSLLYLFSTLLLITIFNDLLVVNILLKLSLAWGICLSLLHIYKILNRGPNKIELSIFVFLIVSLLLTLTYYRSTANLKVWIVNLVLMTGIFFIDDKKSKDELGNELYIISATFSIFMFIAFLISVVIYSQKAGITQEEILYGEKWGLFVYKNSLAISAGVASLLSAFCFLKSRKKPIKIFFLLNVIIQVIAVFVSKGRSALLLLLAIPFIFIFTKFKNKIFRVCLILVPSITCITGFALFHENLFDFLSGRNELWYSAYLLIKNNLFTGVGNEMLVEDVYSMRPDVVLPGIEFGRLHNIFLQIISENGVILLIVFLFLLYFAFSPLVRKIDNSKGSSYFINTTLLSLIVGLVFVNLFESNLIYVTSFIAIIFWLYLAYALSLSNKK